MAYFVVVLLIVIAAYFEAKLLRLPKLAAAYPEQPREVFNKVGIYRIYRGDWSQGIAAVTANQSGLRFRWLLPPKLKPIFIPWSEIWIGGNIDGAIRPRLRVEFAKVPETQYEIRDSLIVQLEELFDGEIPL